MMGPLGWTALKVLLRKAEALSVLYVLARLKPWGCLVADAANCSLPGLWSLSLCCNASLERLTKPSLALPVPSPSFTGRSAQGLLLECHFLSVLLQEALGRDQYM